MLLIEMQLVAAHQGKPGDFYGEVGSLEDDAGAGTAVEGAELPHPYYLQHIDCRVAGQSLFWYEDVEGFRKWYLLELLGLLATICFIQLQARCRYFGYASA
jgi:hypothetical protein